VVAPVLLWPATGPTVGARLAARGLRLAAFLPTVIFLAAWARTFFGSGESAGGRRRARPASHTSSGLNRPPLGEDLRTFVQWLGGGYRGSSRRDRRA
jgi:hypothetical protein